MCMFWPWSSSSFMVSRPYRYSHWLFGYLCILAKAKPLLLTFLIAITLTGCLSGLRNVYLLRLQVPGNSMEVRIGYFGIDCHLRDVCSMMSADPIQNRNMCRNVVRELYANTRRDSRDSHLKTFCFGRRRPFQHRSRRQSQFAKHDRSSTQHAAKKALLHPHCGGWSLHIISDCSDASQTGLKKFGNFTATNRRARYRQAVIALTWSSVALAGAATVGIAESLPTVQFVTNGVYQAPISLTAGTELKAFQWVIVSLSTIYGLGISSIFKVTDGTVKSAGSRGPGAGATPPLPPLLLGF